MDRPNELQTGGTLTWPIYVTTIAGQFVDADDVPAVSIRRGVAAVADAVTVSKRAGTTGQYDCSYTPASTSIDERIEVTETVTIGGEEYPNPWSFRIVAENQDAAILARIGTSGGKLVNNTLPGGKLVVKQGDAHLVANGHALELVQDDAGQVLYGKLLAEDVTSRTCGFRQASGQPSEMVGTIDADNISYDAETEKTTILIEVQKDQADGKTEQNWYYDIEVTIGSDKPKTLITGLGRLDLDNA